MLPEGRFSKGLLGGPLLDPFFRLGLDNSVHEDPWRMDVIWIEGSRGDDLLDLGNRHLAAHGDERIEVSSGLAEDEVSNFICTPGFDQ